MLFHHRFSDRSKLIGAIVLLTILAFLTSSCKEANRQESKNPNSKKAITDVKSEEQFNTIIETSQNHLLLFEFYADWCLPCKALEPILKEIAEEYRDRVEIYKINYDENKMLVKWFKVRGIPYVGFVKNKIIVYSLLGLQPKENYIMAIKSYI